MPHSPPQDCRTGPLDKMHAHESSLGQLFLRCKAELYPPQAEGERPTTPDKLLSPPFLGRHRLWFQYYSPRLDQLLRLLPDGALRRNTDQAAAGMASLD